MPTRWLNALELQGSHRQTLRRARRAHAVSAPRAGRCRGRSRRSTTASCARCCGSRPTTASSSSRRRRSPAATATTVHTDRGDAARAADRRRRSAGGACCRTRTPIQPPERAPLARPGGAPARHAARRWSCGSTRATCAPATRWSFPAERRAARRRRLVLALATTSRSRPCGSRDDLGLPAERYQGNWIPHQLRRGGRGRRVLRRRLGRALPAH